MMGRAHIIGRVPQNDSINSEVNEMMEVESEADGQAMESDGSFQDALQNLNSPESVGREEEITPQKESYSDEERADSEDSEEENVEQHEEDAKHQRRVRAAAAKKEKDSLFYFYE